MNTCPNCGKVAGLHSSILQGCMCQYSIQVPAQTQEPVPPPWWTAVENILNEYGLQAIDFVADFKQALAQTQEPVQCKFCNDSGSGSFGVYSKCICQYGKTTPPQRTEQEPVAHCKVRPLRGDESFPKVEIDWVNQPVPGPLYTTPPQRTWVELEKKDMPDGENPMFDHEYFIAGMVFAAKVLKEKNT